jgi:ATP-dependent helicase HrpB
MTLPVETAWPELSRALSAGTRALLVAPPGAGKSTWIPLQLLGEPWVGGRGVLLLEPRRLAARAVAERMASTLREKVGETVGYRMRLDTRVGPRTRLTVVTEGVLTRMLQQDQALEGVAAVIFDEFHERSIAADLGLALALQSQQLLAPELRLLVMSATLDDERLARLLTDAPVVRAEGRTHEVSVHYLGRGLPPLPDARDSLTAQVAPVAASLRRIVGDTDGDILCFLPGVPEIRRIQGLLEEGGLPQGVLVHPLFGDMDLAAQHAVLAASPPGRRRLILATNVAETSVTLEGLRVVVDSGLTRRSRFDPSTGMGRLVTERISRASAAQRAGRAGRTAPGECFRLWGESGTPSLAPFTPPEILTADLASLALELAAWGVRDAAELAWLDPPPSAALAQARALLMQLEALDASGQITAHGREMASQGLHPRLAHLLLRGRARGEGGLAATLVALLSERDLLRGQADPDLRSRLELLRAPGPGVDRGALARIRRLRDTFAGAGERDGGDAQAGVLLSFAWPDRIAQPRGEGALRRYLLANGRGARLPRASSLDSAELLVAVDLDDAEGAEATLRLAAPLTLRQLEDAHGAHIVTEDRRGFDEREGAVIARRVRRYGALVLGEERLAPDAQATEAALLDVLRERGLGLLDWDEPARQLRARLAFVGGLARTDLAGWPRVDDESLLAMLPRWLGGRLAGISRLTQLTRVPVAEALRGLLDRAQQRRLDELAPAQLTMPTGSKLAVDYVDDNAPCLSVRMQEVFGLAETPRIGGGRVPVTLKLLSPARRPMQITRDLAGFWRGSYADVRKDMRGRYPRHYWPENPLEAEPTRGLRRRSE